MTWGGLNPALTSWRNGINSRFPSRDQTTDGARADKHHGKASQHQEDKDGTVDAYDQDVNLLRSGEANGSQTELRIMEALKRDFEADPRAYLWIHRRKIASRRIGLFERRDYGGDSPHTQHGHWESREAFEDDGSPWKFTHTDALLRELNGEEDDMTPADMDQLAGKIAGALLTTKVTVGAEQWTVGACVGYIARKAFEQDLNTDGVEALLSRVADGIDRIAAGPTTSTGAAPQDAAAKTAAGAPAKATPQSVAKSK